MQTVSSRPARAAPHPARAAGWRAPPGLVLTVIGAGVAAVIALWWRDTPAVTGLGDALTGAGRILGLLAGYGVVVLVALMARLPPLERGLGADPLSARNLAGLVPGLHRRQAYVCGPPGMTQTAIGALRAAGVPRRRIHHESFDF